MIFPMLLLLGAHPVQRDTMPGCTEVHTTVQREECLRNKLAREDKLLTKEESRVRASLTQPAAVAFDSAAKLWRVYRTQECKAVYTGYSDGSIAGSEFAGCEIELTKARRSALSRLYVAEK